MFRLFIEKKIRTTRGPKKRATKVNSRRNRRVYERFSVDHKHLTMMNDQDILLIREISEKGFSSQVSKRGWSRFTIGDVYLAKMRYLGEIYEVEAKVSWKATKDTIGFELMKADTRTKQFMHRLLYPIELANSLSEVDAKFMSESNDGKIWYHGDNDTDLYLWIDQTGTLTAWQLVSQEIFLDWNPRDGLRTGIISIVEQGGKAILELPKPSLMPEVDRVANPQTKQFAIDVIMAANIEKQSNILETLLS